MKLFAIILSFLIILFSISNLDGECMKRWWYHHTDPKDWQFQYIDQWGGENSSCVADGGDCDHWDWFAHYPDVMINPTPPYTNTPSYGDSLVRASAQLNGLTLPGDLGFPTLTIEIK